MPSHNRLYTLLNVLPDADPVVIEAAYKALMKRHHPDMHPEGSAAGERSAAELNHAFRVLRDPGRRAAYDADQRAREERRRAELARSLQPAAPRPAPPPTAAEPGRAGQRLSVLIGVAGFLLLGGALYVFAQDAGPQITSLAPARTASGAVNLDRARAAFRDQPVNRGEVERAIGAFRQIAQSSGVSGAVAYSRRCFDGQSRSREVNAYDHCVAFDHVASRSEAAVKSAEEGRFLPYSSVPRHIRAAELIARDPGLIEARLFEIRRLTDSELSRLTAPAPVQLSAAPAPAPPIVRRAAPARLRVQPARPAAQRRPPAEQDFLERQGGIY